MNTKEIAEQLDGIQYGDRIPQNIITQAKAAGIVIVHGASDDLIKFHGAIDDDLYCYNDEKFWITGKGLYPVNKCNEGDNCPNYVKPTKNTAVPLYTLWDGAPCAANWSFRFRIPHYTFKIWDEECLYCIGIVFSLIDVEAYLEEQAAVEPRNCVLADEQENFIKESDMDARSIRRKIDDRWTMVL